MATNTIRCSAPPDVVFRVLCAPRYYQYFVVGTRAIRRFDPTWPEPGSTFDHSLGFLVTVIRDHTRSLAVQDGRSMTMRTYMRPLAVNDVVFEIEPHGTGTRLSLTETAVEGPGASPPLRQIAEVLFWLRNVWVCRRLRRVVERRAARLSIAEAASATAPEGTA